MTEVWRPVVGFEGLYEVSDLGRVRRERILRPGLAGKGYLHVCLCKNGVRHDRYVHVLVAEAFIGPRPPGSEVRHRDGVKTNCAATNLHYGTPAENNADKKVHGTHFVGEEHHNAVLTEAEVREIRSAVASDYRLGLAYGVASATVRDVRLRKTWRHV